MYKSKQALHDEYLREPLPMTDLTEEICKRLAEEGVKALGLLNAPPPEVMDRVARAIAGAGQREAVEALKLARDVIYAYEFLPHGKYQIVVQELNSAFEKVLGRVPEREIYDDEPTALRGKDTE